VPSEHNKPAVKNPPRQRTDKVKTAATVSSAKVKHQERSQ
jgi:hypothetical protein